MNRATKWILLTSLVSLVFAALLLSYPYLRPTPQEALWRFGLDQVAEDQITCPLIRAGPSACSAIAAEVANPSAPQRRRYAIGALGNLGCAGAAPLLVDIVYDDAEESYVRGDALEALWLIDREVADSLIDATAGQHGHMGDAARRLQAGHRPFTLSYWEAVLCPHW